VGIGFLGEAMLHFPVTEVEKGNWLNMIGRGWKEKKVGDFIMLVNEALEALSKLAGNRSPLTRNLYQILITLFQEINSEKVKSPSIQLKKEYLVENFRVVILQYPRIPSHYFIEAYPHSPLGPPDFHLLTTAIHWSQDIEGLTRIGQFLLKAFSDHPLLNADTGPLIYTVANKTVDH
jgi:hypothetical protein